MQACRGRSHPESGRVRLSQTFSREEYTVVIDAVFGVGLSRPVTGRYAEVIKAMNQKKGQKVAVDVPSGISSFDGQCAGSGVSCGL